MDSYFQRYCSKGRNLTWHIKALGLYGESLYGSSKYTKNIDDIHTYCMFIGHGRSGHSLIGSLLDAHPDMVIAHELDALRYVDVGFSKRQLVYLILTNSRAFSKAGRTWTGYTYHISGQWQGRFRQLQIIGDKKGNRSVMRLSEKPQLIRKVSKMFGNHVKYLHVIRNPFDNISTIAKRRLEKGGEIHPLRDCIRGYFARCEKLAAIKAHLNPTDVFELRHEDFLEHPMVSLRQLCQFLGTSAPDDYLRDCAAIVYKTPHKSRHEAPWTPELIASVQANIEHFPWLAHYTYHD